MYRFGDGTPFPLRENFIDTIVAAVDCCVAIYRVEIELEERQTRARDAEKSAVDELRRLEALKGLIETAVAPLLSPTPGVATRLSEQAAARIFESADSIIRQSHATIVSRRDNVLHDEIPTALRDRVRSALSELFRAHSLPRTEWRVRWQAPVAQDAVATAEIGAQATRELELSFLTVIPSDSAWARPLAVSELVPGPIESVVDIGNGKRRAVRLDGYVVTEVHVAPGRESIVLRESGKRASPGLHIILPRGNDTGPLAIALDKRDRSQGQPFHLDDAGSMAIRLLWKAIDEVLPGLFSLRGSLATARIGALDIGGIDHPSEVAEAVLMSLAPLVREMRMKSRVPGELILKRDLAGDRREEMFVPRQTLWEKIGTLPSRHRQVFEAIGLGNEATTEFVTRIGLARPAHAQTTVRVDPAPPARTAPAPAPHPRTEPPRPPPRGRAATGTGNVSDRGSYTVSEPATFSGGESEVEPTVTRSRSDRFTAVSGVIELRIPA